MGTSRDSDGFSDEEELEESFDSNEDEKPHGSEGDEDLDEDEKELEESFDSNEDEKSHGSEGNEYEDKKELEEGFDFNEDEKPHGSEGDEDEEELEESFDSKEDEKPHDSDGDEDKEELGVRFDFIGDEKPRCSDDNELTDSEEISTPSTSPPKGKKNSIQNRISASPAKQPKEARDRISILQDSLLIRILSFLPTKDAVRTGILSKRWQYLWTSVENISLKYRYSSYATDDKCAQKFITFVDKALVLFTSSDIRKFSLDFKYDRRFAPSVNLWVRFAMQNNVEELELNLHNRCRGNRYKLPQYVFANSVLAKLNLAKCKIFPDWLVSWKSLRALTIKCAVLWGTAIRRILWGSPVLEFLEFYRCCIKLRLDIDSQSLKKLVIRGYRNPYYEDDSQLKISAPNVSSLEIVGHLRRKKILLVNVSSLSDAKFDFDPLDDTRMLTHLLLSTRHVKDLTLGFRCIQVLSKLEVKGLTFPLSERKCLTLLTHMKKWDLTGISNLLQSSPNLAMLVIDMASPHYLEVGSNFCDSYNFDGKSYWTSQARDLKCMLQHLKTVKIAGFTGDSCEFAVALIQLLLENAPVLEKMVINAGIVGCTQYSTSSVSLETFHVIQKLLSFPRTSQQVVVTFRHINIT